MKFQAMGIAKTFPALITNQLSNTMCPHMPLQAMVLIESLATDSAEKVWGPGMSFEVALSISFPEEGFPTVFTG